MDQTFPARKDGCGIQRAERMRKRQPPKRDSGRQSVGARRVFWLGLLALHAAALPSIWGALKLPADASDHVALTLRLVAMSGSTLFFLLKILDVPALRFCPGWRSAVAAIVVVAVLHVGVVDRAITGEFETNPLHVKFVFFMGSLCCLDSLAACLRLVLAILTPVRVWRAQLHAAFDRVWYAVHPAPRAVLVPAYAGTRAPPSQ